MSNSNALGKELEDAVRKIETAILSISPDLQSERFVIDSNRVEIIEGVRHEIDIWVEINPAKGYSSRFIFECKNWQDKVSKNEIIVFSEKIDAVQAQRGFFIARSFTKYAETQAAKDPRIVLLNAQKHDPTEFPGPLGFHFIIRQGVHADFLFFHRSEKVNSVNQRIALEPTSLVATLNGSPFDIDAYIKEWADELAEERLKEFSSGEVPSDIYILEKEGERDLESMRLVVNGLEVVKAEMNVKVTVRVHRPSIISHYEVKSRGRVIKLDSLNLDTGGNIDVALITVE